MAANGQGLAIAFLEKLSRYIKKIYEDERWGNRSFSLIGYSYRKKRINISNKRESGLFLWNIFVGRDECYVVSTLNQWHSRTGHNNHKASVRRKSSANEWKKWFKWLIHQNNQDSKYIMHRDFSSYHADGSEWSGTYNSFSGKII